MRLEIPDNNDPKLPEVVERLLQKESNHKITGIYGKLTMNQFQGSGRTNTNDFTREQAEERIDVYREMGLNFNCTNNSVAPEADVLENRPKIIEELRWLEELGISSLTVADYGLARLAGNYCPSIGLTTSFFAEVDNKTKLLQWAKLPNVKVINTGRPTYRNIPLLEELVKIAGEHDTKIKVIANLGCMSDCIQTVGHAIIKSYASIDAPALHCRPFTFYCMKLLLEDPEKFLKLPIIRPEDLDAYANIGVDSVKLVDRSQSSDWIEKVVGYYLDGNYRGNILDLTCNFTSLDLNKMSNEEVSKVNMDKVVASRAGVREYRRILPELMGVSIDPEYDFLACDNVCDDCAECKDNSALKYDPDRIKMVLDQLNIIEDNHSYK